MNKYLNIKELQAKPINLREGTPDTKREEIKEYFLKTWELDEKLYSQLRSDEVFYHRGDPLRHIILFYLGHTAVFYINKMILGKLIDQRINPKFESIFAIGVDEMSWDDLNNAHYDWPKISEVWEYREKVKNTILTVIDNAALELPITWESPFWIINMGIEHQRIHLETSSVLIRQLDLKDVVSGQFGKICSSDLEPPKNELIKIKKGNVQLGKNEVSPLYGWDCEYGNLQDDVEAFKAAKYLTSNKEFLEFVEDNGYEKSEFWTEEGWNWNQFQKRGMPLFWIKKNNEYQLRLMADVIPMPWSWPVEVNYLEAKAFCNWKSKKENKTYRLPTEAEWIRIHQESGLQDILEWDTAPANINLEHFLSPCPVNQFKHGDFYDVIGNVWQWTETPISGYPGFKVHPIYDDFSTPTFDGKHNLIKGGSWISSGNEATFHARYAFRRHFYQHAGFRYIESDNEPNLQIAAYEEDKEVSISCENNWYSDDYNSFHQKFTQSIVELAGKNEHFRVLDLNADTGRLAFELAQYYKDVTALDFTARMIRIPIQLQELGYVRYVMPDEGQLVHYREVVLSDFDFSENKANILFMQADPMNLKPNFSGYDVVILPNLLEELSNPIDFLKEIETRINSNGYLIIASDYNWNAKRTDFEYWLGGFKEDGEPVTTLDGLKKVLEPNFDLIKEPFDLEQKTALNSRNYSIKKLEISCWRKKA